MNTHKINDSISILLASITSMGVGAFLFQLVGAFLLGLVGALAGWIFTKIIKPLLDKWHKKLTSRKFR